MVITLAPPDLGGFLRFLLGDGIELEVAVDVDISTSGVRVGGSLGLAFSVTLNKQLGILYLDLLDIALVAGTDSLQATARITVRLELGPILIELSGLGVALTLRPSPDGDGSLGELDVTLELLAPTRLVVVVESDVVNGGGFVDYDPATGRYTGGLAVDLFGVGISALVVVDTMIPGDPDAWALFASLGATFPSPIPLGFGFTLARCRRRPSPRPHDGRRGAGDRTAQRRRRLAALPRGRVRRLGAAARSDRRLLPVDARQHGRRSGRDARLGEPRR